ncbi:glycosyltransferase family 4 protein [Litoreibacter roseus]|uniref:Glycosyl transferase n=1 Tax=Litoreibacter roseus TaxID=2601869 RepID=A0A6N6JEV3_9RHOB|nr:glycosyltransferase family 4 protein [Litoreibacter roseus]GFE64654.1 glycosyl transferase [Litoreibacter roseus]
MNAVFAIPGDMHQRTGGYIYEATVLRVLNEINCSTEHLQLPDSFPDPTPGDMVATLRALQDIPADRPVILDGLVSGAIDPDGIANLAAPVIAMVHHPLGLETGLPPSRAAELLANEAAVLKHVTHVLVPSAHTADILTKQFGVPEDRITIALPGFDRPKITAKPSNPPLILSVGLLAPRKGHDVLLDALAGLKDLDWRAVIAGKVHDAAYASSLIDQLTRLGLAGRVQFTGELSALDLADRFAAASIFALATRYEGYGMVLSEAMLYGLPVISCAVGAVPDTVGDAGILVPPNDPEQLAGALRTLLTDPAAYKQYKAAAVAKANDLPTWQDTAKIIASVIKDVANRAL